MLKIEETNKDMVSRKTGNLYSPGYPYVHWTKGHRMVVIDGELSPMEMLQIACYAMRNGGRPGEVLAARRIESAGKLSRTVRKLAAIILKDHPSPIGDPAIANVTEALP